MDVDESGSKKCPKCGSYTKGKFCPDCGERLASHIDSSEVEVNKVSKWKDRLFLIVFIIAAIIIWAWLQAPTNGGYIQTQTITDPYSEMTLSDVKNRATQVSDVTAIARYPSDNLGKVIAFDGKIVQVQQNGDDYVLRINSECEINYQQPVNQDMWVNYHRKSGGRPLEGDKVTTYGKFTGMKTYNTVLGSSKTIPEITGYYIERNDRE